MNCLNLKKELGKVEGWRLKVKSLKFKRLKESMVHGRWTIAVYLLARSSGILKFHCKTIIHGLCTIAVYSIVRPPGYS
jgi:hypothetical protein